MTYIAIALVAVSLVYFAWQAYVKFAPKSEPVKVIPGIDSNRMEAHRCYEWLRKYLETENEVEARTFLNKSASSLYSSNAPKTEQPTSESE